MPFSDGQFFSQRFLVAGGIFATTKAAQINKRYLQVALMPLFAGLQQFLEGKVWWGAEDFGIILEALGMRLHRARAAFATNCLLTVGAAVNMGLRIVHMHLPGAMVNTTRHISE